MNDTSFRQKLAKVAEEHPETRQYLVPLLKDAAVVADKLPKPSPWSVPIPWEEAQDQVAANLKAFESAGCKIRKLRPVNDPYVTMLYKGNTFTMSLGRRMLGVEGNLWVETEDAIDVASKMPRLVGIVNALRGAGQSGGYLTTSHIKKVEALYPSKWSRLLAHGIATTMLELGGMPVIETDAELAELTSEP